MSAELKLFQQERLGKAEKAIDDSKSHRRHYEDKKKEHDAKVFELSQHHDQYQQEIASDVAKAQQMCEERITTRRSPNNLASEIRQMKKRIEAEEETRGSRDEITRTFNDKLIAYKKIKKEVGQLALFLEVCNGNGGFSWSENGLWERGKSLSESRLWDRQLGPQQGASTCGQGTGTSIWCSKGCVITFSKH